MAFAKGRPGGGDPVGPACRSGICREASISDQELRTLWDEIGAGRRQEIEQMERILARLQ